MLASERRQLASQVVSDARDVREQPARQELVHEEQARSAREQVAAKALRSPALRRDATSSLTSAAPIGMPAPSAFPIATSEGRSPSS